MIAQKYDNRDKITILLIEREEKTALRVMTSRRYNENSNFNKQIVNGS